MIKSRNSKLPKAPKPEKVEVIEAENKSPIVAGILNFLIWGAGYIYNDLRPNYGFAWVIVFLIFCVNLININLVWGLSMPIGIYNLLSHFMISFLLAFDAYEEINYE